MSDFDQLTLKQTIDLGNKIGGQRAKRFMSGELVLVERNALPVAISPQGLANGGVTYASDMNVEEFLEDWLKFLKEIFKVSLPSRRKIVLPKTRPGFGWGVLAPKGMTIERALASYADVCPIWRWTNNNLDEITKSVRPVKNSTYIAWFRDRIEADEEHCKKSYNDLQTARINSITLLERLLLGRWFHYKVGRHLDVISVTRCDGSLYFSVGLVPGVCWDGHYGRLFVYEFGPDHCDVNLRSREAVS